MQVLALSQFNETEVTNEAAGILARGGSIVYPTDTVYGLGVNPFDDFAVGRLFRIKRREASKPVPLMVKSIAMAKKLAHIGAREEKILKRVWPGAVSVVLHKRKLVSSLISANTATVALRIPDGAFCARLLKSFNSPITCTSANISGENHTNDSKEIIKRFSNEMYKPDLIIDAGKLTITKPSTVLDLTGPRPKITRIGPVKPKELARMLEI